MNNSVETLDPFTKEQHRTMVAKAQSVFDLIVAVLLPHPVVVFLRKDAVDSYLEQFIIFRNCANPVGSKALYQFFKMNWDLRGAMVRVWLW